MPDLRLFVRGDEVEMHRRLVRSGLPFGTALGAAYLHPRPTPTSSSRCSAAACTPSDPDDPVKRYYTYRNRGFLTAQPGMRRVGVAELPRFAWYFLVTKRSPREFARWLRLVRQGGWSASTGPEGDGRPASTTAARDHQLGAASAASAAPPRPVITLCGRRPCAASRS